MGIDLNSGIWERQGQDVMSRDAFVRTTAFFTIAGMALVAFKAMDTYDVVPNWPLFIASFLASVIGIVVFTRLNNWALSAGGVMIMCFGLGALIGPTMPLFGYDVVVPAIVGTAFISITMSVVGILVPSSMEGMGPYLSAGLSFLILMGFGEVFLQLLGFSVSQFQVGHLILAAFGVFLFSMYIAYDWNRAMRMPYTMDNAVDTAGALILDIVNLFLQLLKLLYGSKRK